MRRHGKEREMPLSLSLSPSRPPKERLLAEVQLQPTTAQKVKVLHFSLSAKLSSFSLLGEICQPSTMVGVTYMFMLPGGIPI